MTGFTRFGGNSCFDAYKVGKRVDPRVVEKLESTQIFDVWIIGDECHWYFRTK